MGRTPDSQIITRRQALWTVTRDTSLFVAAPLILLDACAQQPKKEGEQWSGFRSRNFPYSTEYPKHWRAVSDTTTQIDMFTPDIQNAHKLNISVDAYPLVPGATLEQVANKMIDQDRTDFANVGVQIADTVVSGPQTDKNDEFSRVAGRYDAYHIRQDVPSSTKLTNHVVIFTAGDYGWHVMLSGFGSEISENLPKLKHTLDAFTIQQQIDSRTA
jgi:hypothetical protein